MLQGFLLGHRFVEVRGRPWTGTLPWCAWKHPFPGTLSRAEMTDLIEAEVLDSGALVRTTDAGDAAGVTLALHEAAAAGDDLNNWLQHGLGAESRRAYERDFRLFARWLAPLAGEPAPQTSADVHRILWVWLMQGKLPNGPVSARKLVSRWQQAQLEQGKAGATVARRVASLKWISRQAALHEIVDLRLDLLRAAKPEPTDRDMTGVGSLAALGDLAARGAQLGRTEAERARNRLVLMLLAWNALRRGEISRLSLADWNPDEPEILRIRGKGRSQREQVTLPPATSEAITAWLEHRPGWAPTESWAPLLVSLDPRAAHRARNVLPAALALAAADLAEVQEQSPAWWNRMTEATSSIRLDGSSIYRLVRSLGVGSKVLSPHRLRHSAITSAVRELNLSLADAQELARHKNPQTTSRYVDRKGETQARVTNALASAGMAMAGAAA